MNKRTLLAACLTLASLFSTACGGTIRYALLGGREYSTTEGEAQFVERDGGGYTMDVAVDHLPTAERLGMSSAHFIVWTRAIDSETFVRADELEVDARTRTGRATAAVATRELELKITAETSADATEPAGTVLIDAVLDPED